MERGADGLHLPHRASKLTRLTQAGVVFGPWPELGPRPLPAIGLFWPVAGLGPRPRLATGFQGYLQSASQRPGASQRSSAGSRFCWHAHVAELAQRPLPDPKP
eukprot:363455-Chlamydomonas_euryale.AAC.1